MSRKSYSLFVVVIVLAVLALSQLACSGSGGGGDTSMSSDCKPGMAQTVDGKSCVVPTTAPAPTTAPKVQPTLDAASNAAKTAVQNIVKVMNVATGDKAKRRAKVDTKTAESLPAVIEQQVKLIVRVAQLRKTMSEARQVAEAADRNYAFAEEAGSRATELALWGTLFGYHAKRVEDRWIVAEFEGKLELDATLQEVLLRARKYCQDHKDERCQLCPHKSTCTL